MVHALRYGDSRRPSAFFGASVQMLAEFYACQLRTMYFIWTVDNTAGASICVGLRQDGIRNAASAECLNRQVEDPACDTGNNNLDHSDFSFGGLVPHLVHLPGGV